MTEGQGGARRVVWLLRELSPRLEVWMSSEDTEEEQRSLSAAIASHSESWSISEQEGEGEGGVTASSISEKAARERGTKQLCASSK